MKYSSPSQYRRSWDRRYFETAVLGGSITITLNPYLRLETGGGIGREAVLGWRRYWEGDGIGRGGIGRDGIGRDDLFLIPDCHLRQTPYLMAIACNQKAQSQLLLLNDAFPTLPETSSNVIVSCGGGSGELWGRGGGVSL